MDELERRFASIATIVTTVTRYIMRLSAITWMPGLGTVWKGCDDGWDRVWEAMSSWVKCSGRRRCSGVGSGRARTNGMGNYRRDWRTLKLRQGPQDDDATVVVFAGRASDPVPRYCVAAANETLMKGPKPPNNAAAFELLENLAKVVGVVAGTPGVGTAVTPGCAKRIDHRSSAQGL